MYKKQGLLQKTPRGRAVIDMLLLLLLMIVAREPTDGLAHLFLSQRDTNLMVGNFIADHIKANKIEPYSEEIRNGIMMHRAIDHFTDTHPLVKKSKSRLFPKYRHCAAVLVDMFYPFAHNCPKTLFLFSRLLCLSAVAAKLNMYAILSDMTQMNECKQGPSIATSLSATHGWGLALSHKCKSFFSKIGKSSKSYFRENPL